MATRKSTAEEQKKRIFNRVKVLRTEVGISRAELAARVGVNPQTIGVLERGDHYPSLQLAMNICEVFDVPIEAVYSRAPFASITSAYARGRQHDIREESL